MKYTKNKFKKNKILFLSIIFIFLLVGFIAIPTLSTYKIANSTSTISIWDGSLASSYNNGDGTKENPYIISNGSELLYLASQLETTSYEGEYFLLSNDIILNDGIFSYTKNNGIKYLKDNAESNITPNSENDIINEFKHLNGFKGIFDGNHHTIYGLYIDDTNEEQNALFTNLEGNVSNLYIKNSVIYGGKIAAGIAAKASNSNLTNISFNGYIISDETTTDKVISKEIEDIEKKIIDTENGLSDYIKITELSYIPGLITEVTLSGFYETNNENAVLKINEEVINPGNFIVDLNNQLLTEIPIDYQTNIESVLNLTNLKYEIKYNYSNAAGIISVAENSTLKNVINKAEIYANVFASGVVNTVSGTTSLVNSYNNGKIESNYISTGLISNINLNKEDIIITNCYNSGELTATNSALIGDISNNEGSITLANIFNTKDNYGINLIEKAMVYITDSYVVSNKKIKTGTGTGEFIQTTENNLKTKSFIKEKLEFQEYKETENTDNAVWVWTFESDFLPILYIDELNKPIVNLYIKEKVWNNYNNELETLKSPEKIVLGIEQADALNPVKEIYYYISHEKKSLSKEEINSITEWIPYEEIIEINEEGFYVIYSKIIDNNNNEIYVNTDLIIIDFTSPDITISASFTDETWKNFNTELNHYYINKEASIKIQAEDSLSGINKIYYYISNTILSQEEVENITNWNEYDEEITINSVKSIIYAKVVDNCNYSTYANSDLIILNGYRLNSLSPGMNGDSFENLYITEKSSVALNFSYQDDIEYSKESTHQIISNVLLPQNTKITLIDKTKNKVYAYITTSENYGYNECSNEICEAKYDFNLFNEIGSTLKFQESNYTGQINEEFIVILDFKNANINENIENIKISLRIDNNNQNEIRNTLSNSNKKFSIIFENNQASFELTSTFNNTINYSENEIYTVDFSTKLIYETLQDGKIYDTTFEDKTIGLSIKMVNNNGDIIAKQYLKNILFKIGEKKYSPSSDGIVRINLEKGISNITDNLIIQTYSDNSSLKTGNYKFIVTLYTAYDGLYSNEFLSSIEIPVYVGQNTYNNDNSFNVIMDNEDKIITTATNEFDFEILVSNPTTNNYVKISLYKKNSLSAYDQNYTIIDLEEYLIDKNLEQVDDFVYYASKNVDENNIFNVNIDTSLLEKNGYMFVFELYENDILINKISKKFIVK